MSNLGTVPEYVPSYEELKVPEIQLTFPALKAVSLQMGKYCDNQCKEFMLCRNENTGDPRACLNEGKEVTSCGLEFLKKVKKSPCGGVFTEFWKCMAHAKRVEFKRCSEYQANFDNCVAEHLNQERPFPGYFTKVRLHDTSRPKPVADALPEPMRVPQPEKEPKTKWYMDQGRHS